MTNSRGQMKQLVWYLVITEYASLSWSNELYAYKSISKHLPVKRTEDNVGHVITSKSTKSSIYDERFLQTFETNDDNTDDRHGKDPVDNNSTNGPAFIFTRIPSSVPSSEPSFAPSTRPSSKPSTQPSVSPTYFPSFSPSTSPSLDPCLGRDGLFGSTSNSTGKVSVYYKYGIEINDIILDETGSTVSEVVASAEYSLLNELVTQYFSFCSKDGRRRVVERIVQSIEADEQHNLSEVVGLSSFPTDIANGETCKVQDNMEAYHSCVVMEGRMSIFLSDGKMLGEHRTNMVNSVKKIMDEGALNNSHRVLINVTFISTGTEGNLDPGDDSNDDIANNGGNTVEEIGNSATPWIAIGAGASLLLCITVATRYRYIRSKSKNISGDDDDSDDYECVSNDDLAPTHNNDQNL